MKRKGARRIANWIGRSLWIGVGLGLFGCSGDEFQRNPNLRLLRAPSSDQPGDLYYPVWSGNGRIYYFYARYQRYDLHAINEDGTGDVFLSEWPDQYPPPALAASNDGTKLAVVSDSGACIYILDQNGVLLDTIVPRYPYALDVNFTRDDSGVIFQTEYGRHSVGESGFYKRMFNDTAEILIRQVEWNFPCFGFDVFKGYNDSLYIGSSGFEYPRIRPGNEDEIVYCERYLGYPQNFL